MDLLTGNSPNMSILQAFLHPLDVPAVSPERTKERSGRVDYSETKGQPDPDPEEDQNHMKVDDRISESFMYSGIVTGTVVSLLQPCPFLRQSACYLGIWACGFNITDPRNHCAGFAELLDRVLTM